MADTVTKQTISDTTGIKYVVKLTNFSDGTGETLVNKVDASALTFMTEDGERKLAKVWYSISTSNNRSAVELMWAGATNSTLAIISGNGVEVRGFGGFHKRHRKGRMGVNPKTGNKTEVSEKFVPFFKPGKLLKEAVNKG